MTFTSSTLLCFFCRPFGFQLNAPLLLHRHIRGDLDHFDRLACVIEHRIVGRLDVNLSPRLRDAPEDLRIKLPVLQLTPELTIRLALAPHRIHEDAVMLADDLVQAIAHLAEKIVIGPKDGAIGLKLDQRL